MIETKKKGFGIVDVFIFAITFIVLIITLAKVVVPTINEYVPAIEANFPDTAEFIKFVPLAMVLAFIGYVFVQALYGAGGRMNG